MAMSRHATSPHVTLRHFTSGEKHTVLLMSDGSVQASGAWDGGNTVKSETFTTIVTKDKKVVAVSAGWDFTIVVRLEGTVWGMGLNSVGQLGDGTKITRSAFVQAQGIENVKTVSAGH